MKKKGALRDMQMPAVHTNNKSVPAIRKSVGKKRVSRKSAVSGGSTIVSNKPESVQRPVIQPVKPNMVVNAVYQNGGMRPLSANIQLPKGVALWKKEKADPELKERIGSSLDNIFQFGSGGNGVNGVNGVNANICTHTNIAANAPINSNQDRWYNDVVQQYVASHVSNGAQPGYREDYYNVFAKGNTEANTKLYSELDAFVKRFNGRNKMINPEYIEGLIGRYVGNDPVTGMPYKVNNLSNYLTAFMHESYRNVCYENGIKNVETFQRLEKLGDSRLKVSISNLLVSRYPRAQPSILTQVQIKLEFKKALAMYTKYLGLNQFFIISAQEEAKGTRWYSMNRLEDIFESFLGAMEVDFMPIMGDGAGSIVQIFCKNFLDDFWDGDFYRSMFLELDYKGIWMHVCQGRRIGNRRNKNEKAPKDRFWPNPKYYKVYEIGDDPSNKVFCYCTYVPLNGLYSGGRPEDTWKEPTHLDEADPMYELHVDGYYRSIGLSCAQGVGATKADAEKMAAKTALEMLNVNIWDYIERRL